MTCQARLNRNKVHLITEPCYLFKVEAIQEGKGTGMGKSSDHESVRQEAKNENVPFFFDPCASCYNPRPDHVTPCWLGIFEIPIWNVKS